MSCRRQPKPESKPPLSASRIEEVLFAGLKFVEDKHPTDSVEVTQTLSERQKREITEVLERNADDMEPASTGTIVSKVKDAMKAVYSKTAGLRRRAKAAKARLTDKTVIRAARVLIATIGQAAAFAIFRSVLVEVRNRLAKSSENTVATSGIRGRLMTSTHEMVIAVGVVFFSEYRKQFFSLIFKEPSVAKQVQNSKSIDLMIDTVVDRIGAPCVDAVNNPQFSIAMIMEFCDAFIELTDKSCLRNPRARAEIQKAAYPVIARVLIQSTCLSKEIWIPQIVRKVTNDIKFKAFLARDDAQGVDNALKGLGIQGRADIGNSMEKVMRTVSEALCKSAFTFPDFTFQNIDDAAIAQGEETLAEEELDHSLYQISNRTQDPEDDDDEEFWDADDFITQVDEGDNTRVVFKKEDGSEAAGPLVEALD